MRASPTRRSPRPSTKRATRKQLDAALTALRHSWRRDAERWLDAHSALEVTLHRYIALYEEAPLPFLTVDRNGLIIEVNRACAALLGEPLEPLVGRPLSVFVDRIERRRLVSHLLKCRRDGAAVTEICLLGRDKKRTVELRTVRAVTPNFLHTYATAIIDIDEQRAREEALRASEKLHRDIVETADEGISISDVSNHIVFANRRLASMVAAAPEALVGRLLTELFVDEEHAHHPFETTERAARPPRQLRMCRSDGTTFWANVSTTTMRNPKGRFTGNLQMYTDATVQHELTASRELLMRRLVAAQERERQRIARELHDQFGQHIVALSLGLARLANVVADPDAGALIDNLRRVAELLGKDMHTLALQLRPSSLDHLGLAAALKGYAEEIEQRSGLDIDVHCDGIGADALTDTIQTGLYRVAQEALTNVVKHARAQRVSIVLEHREGWLQLIIEDDGRGFDADKLDRAGGRLGLAGIRERVAIMGGTVAIESAMQKGTSVYVRIPVNSNRAPEHEQETSTPAG